MGGLFAGELGFDMGQKAEARTIKSTNISTAKLDCDSDKNVTEKEKKQKYIRRTLELHPDVDELLTILQKRLKARSHTEVVQKAIQLLGYVVGKEGDSKKLYIEKADGTLQEIIIM